MPTPLAALKPKKASRSKANSKSPSKTPEERAWDKVAASSSPDATAAMLWTMRLSDLKTMMLLMNLDANDVATRTAAVEYLDTTFHPSATGAAVADAFDEEEEEEEEVVEEDTDEEHEDPGVQVTGEEPEDPGVQVTGEILNIRGGGGDKGKGKGNGEDKGAGVWSSGKLAAAGVWSDEQESDDTHNELTLKIRKLGVGHVGDLARLLGITTQKLMTSEIA